MSQRELTLKVVYYGPARSGKTTNLQAIHNMVAPGSAGRLMNLETRDDRTLFFDLLPVHFRTRNNFRIKLKLYTVPGQVFHDSTRQIVLQKADAVAFIADSRIAKTEENQESYDNLLTNLVRNQLDPEQIPLVVQFNKRDLPDIRTDAELNSLAAIRNTPIHRSVAIYGVGVLETLKSLLSLTWDHLEKLYGVSDKLGTDRTEFLEQLFNHWDPQKVREGVNL
ncbi:MAG: GTP-binding protein [Bradymonadia bacterium]